ncbi:acyl-CoA dehydrogenase family protein [Rhizobium sp. G187]|uniref:acyl-CoA dehydrogenase family protein n=1 Tax=Rhizobium sp. G187 TaxID=3451352 RepID=UPI003EE5E311
MGTITQISEKLRPVPQQLVSEDQARVSISDLAAIPAEPTALLEFISKRGLLAISVPDDFGGADLSNELMADLLMAIAERSALAAVRAASHFVALELVRTSGSVEQRRAIYSRVLLGERLAHVGFHLPDIESFAHGLALGISLPSSAVPSLEQDWTILPLLNPDGRRGIAILSAESLRPFPETASTLRLAGDHFLLLGESAERLATALGVVLDAAMTRAFLCSAKAGEDGFQLPGRTDAGDVWNELLAAMITRLAGVIDGLQVGATTVNISKLETAEAALRALNLRAREGRAF